MAAITVLNPTGYPPKVTAKPMAPRGGGFGAGGGGRQRSESRW